MSNTLIITHPDCLGHQPGASHPESPRRLQALHAALSQAPWADWPQELAPLATDEMLALAHTQQHVAAVLSAIPPTGLRAIDADTLVSPGSGQAVRRAVGAVLRGVEAVQGSEYQRVFCAVRPPGHHAEGDRAMGFCLFNGIAVGALHALQQADCRRVAIVDFDVHHGNGTQAIFAQEPRVLYCSSHQMPLYPGTGAADERGLNNIVNVPLAPGAGSQAFKQAYQDNIFPALRAFKPDLLLLSAGFDAHREDPLAGLCLQTEDYAWVTRQLVGLASEVCGGKIVSVLEGGYHLEALVDSVLAHLGALQGGPRRRAGSNGQSGQD